MSQAQGIKIKCVDKLGVFITKKKRIKILVGGRASTKSTFVADYVSSKVSQGETWCCGREFQNSIGDSVHSLLKEEIERCELLGFEALTSEIKHSSGGRAFYTGLARNIQSVKSVITNGMWIEEGETLSQNTIDVLTASIRLSAGQAKKLQDAGKELSVPEIWITMNRGSRKDPISTSFLERAEPDLAKTGYYEDENMMVMEINYTDVPKEWFEGSGLETERASDEANMSTAMYNWKWLGHYNDTVPNAIIEQDWFDACVDAHTKIPGFKALGQEKVAYDPSDVGPDPEAIAYMHGSIVKEAMSADVKDVELATDWATSFANEVKCDAFVWDCDGMGSGLKRQVAQAFEGKKIETHQFKGSHGAHDPEEIYQHIDGEDKKKATTNEAMFSNQRSQFYWTLRDRIYKTYLAVQGRSYVNPDELISFSSDIKHLKLLRAEICRIPRKFVGNGRIQLLTKPEMLAKKIPSPNMADCVMMLMKPLYEKKKKVKKIKFREHTVKDMRVGY